MKNLRILDLAYNPFTDISVLSELRKLEAVNLYEVSVENLEVLAEPPSLKLIVYEPKIKTGGSLTEIRGRRYCGIQRKRL